MSCIVDTTPLIAGSCVVSQYPGFGITGAAMRAATASGGAGPGLPYNDWDSGDDAKEFMTWLMTPPASGTLTLNEDGSFSLVGAVDGSYSLVYRLWVDGVDLGTATASITVGAGATFSVAASGLPSTISIGAANFAFSAPGAFAVSAAGVPSTLVIGAASLSFQLEPGATLVTLTQAQQYLLMQLGVELPSFVVQSAIDRTSPLLPAMSAAGYTSAEQVMIQCIAVALIAAAGMPRRLSSQAAPSGASRSFKYTDRDLWALRRSLAALDTAGVMTQVVGPDPTAVAMFMVV